MRYKAFLFDMDGTLIDSMPTFASVILNILDDKGFEYQDDFIKIITPLGLKGTADYCIQQGLDISQQEMLSLMIENMKGEYANNIPAKSNVISTLKSLKEYGYSLNVLTASPHDTLDPCLKRLGVWKLFDFIWSCEDFGTTKSDANIYRMAAEQIGVDIAEILFLDDNCNACLSAKNAGIGVCGVYDESSAEYEAEMRSITDLYIKDFSELMRFAPQ